MLKARPPRNVVRDLDYERRQKVARFRTVLTRLGLDNYDGLPIRWNWKEIKEALEDVDDNS